MGSSASTRAKAQTKAKMAAATTSRSDVSCVVTSGVAAALPVGAMTTSAGGDVGVIKQHHQLSQTDDEEASARRAGAQMESGSRVKWDAELQVEM